MPQESFGLRLIIALHRALPWNVFYPILKTPLFSVILHRVYFEHLKVFSIPVVFANRAIISVNC